MRNSAALPPSKRVDRAGTLRAGLQQMKSLYFSGVVAGLIHRNSARNV